MALTYRKDERLLYKGGAPDATIYVWEATEVTLTIEDDEGPNRQATIRWIDVWMCREEPVTLTPGEFPQWRDDLLTALDAAYAVAVDPEACASPDTGE